MKIGQRKQRGYKMKRKSFRKTEFTILYKNLHTLGGVNSRSADHTLYEFKVMAKSRKEATSALTASRTSLVKSTIDGKLQLVKLTRHYKIVRVSDGSDTRTFKDFRGVTRQKYVTILPSKMPAEMR